MCRSIFASSAAAATVLAVLLLLSAAPQPCLSAHMEETEQINADASVPYPLGSVPNVASHIIHIVMDGLRSDHMSGPNFNLLKTRGACTLNARHDWASSQTLPNHIGMFTGLIIADHGYEEDADNGDELVNTNGFPFENIFDLVKANGGTTAFYGSKEKFEVFHRSFNIDRFEYQKRGKTLVPMFLMDMNNEAYTYAFLHVRNPDRAGHGDIGADSRSYRDAVVDADTYLGEVFQLIENNPTLKGKTALIVTADHGFADVGNHADEELLQNYRIPFCAYGPSVKAGADLIALNSPANGGIIEDPGEGRGGEFDRIIRNSNAPVLAADWLGFKPNSGVFANQFLAVGDRPREPMFTYKRQKMKTCLWLGRLPPDAIALVCETRVKDPAARDSCPNTCGLSQISRVDEANNLYMHSTKVKKTCRWLANREDTNRAAICSRNRNARGNCPSECS